MGFPLGFICRLCVPLRKSCQCCSECVPLSWLLSTEESPQPAGVNVWSPSSLRSFNNTDYSRPMRHYSHVLLTHALKTSPGHDFVHALHLTHTHTRQEKKKVEKEALMCTCPRALCVFEQCKHALQISFQLVGSPRRGNGKVSRKRGMKKEME